jgi:aspartate-semialdehyde dehydrogenase
MPKDAKFRIALIGTDSLRGKEIKNALERDRFPLKSLELFDPKVREEFSKLTNFRDEAKVIHHLDKKMLEGLDLVFLASTTSTNREYGLLARKLDYRAVDLAETFNDDPDIPLVVAGVNDEAARGAGHNLVANPNPVTIFLSHLYHALREGEGIRRSAAFVLQPASAFDEPGIKELVDESCALLSSSQVSRKIFREQAAFNFLSRTEKPGSNGFSSRERQILSEIRRVLGRPEFPLSLSIVQAPVFHTYSIMTYVELERDAGIARLVETLKAGGVFDLSFRGGSAPATATNVAGKDKIFVGEIKKEEDIPGAFWIWLVADNLTAGSAVNACEIARSLLSSLRANA